MVLHIYDGNTYNLNSFLTEHPGGHEILRGTEGYDISEIVRVYHTWTKVHRKSIERFRVPCEGLVAREPVSTPEWNTLRVHIRDHLTGYHQAIWFWSLVYSIVGWLSILYLFSAHLILWAGSSQRWRQQRGYQRTRSRRRDLTCQHRHR